MRKAGSKAGWTVYCLGLFLGLSGLPCAQAQDTITLDQCRDQVLSGDFVVTDGGKDFRPLNNVPRELAKAVQELIDRKASKDFGRSEEKFDRIYGTIMKKILEGRWAIDETSQVILDDCYFAVHPNADTTE